VLGIHINCADGSAPIAKGPELGTVAGSIPLVRHPRCLRHPLDSFLKTLRRVSDRIGYDKAITPEARAKQLDDGIGNTFVSFGATTE